MISGADENEPEDQPSTPTTTPPSSPLPPQPPPPPIASPSSPLQQIAGVGLGRRLLGSIRSLLPASPPSAATAPRLGLGLLLHLTTDHPRLHPTPTPPASASEDDLLEEDAAAARPHAAAGRGDGGFDAAAGMNSPEHTGGDVALEGDQKAGLVDGQQGAAPAAKEFRAAYESRPTDLASPSAFEENKSRATGILSAPEDDDLEEVGPLDSAEWLRAAEGDAGAGLRLPPVCGLREDSAATRTAPPNILLLQCLRPAAETGGELALGEDHEGGLVLVDEQKGTIHTQAAAPAEGDAHFCASYESGASEEEDLVGEKDKVVEQQGAADRQGTLVKDVDAAGDDQEKVLQQCTGDQLRAARDDQEVGEQDAIHVRGDETTCGIGAVEDHEKVGSAEDVDVVEGQEVVLQDGIHPRDATIYFVAVEEQEKVEGYGNNQCGSTGNNDAAVEDQEVLLPDVIDRKGEGTDGTAVDDQDKAVQQCGTYELGTPENNDDDDDQEAVEQGVCNEGVMDDDNADEDHDAAAQIDADRMHATIDDIGVEDQEKGVYATYDLGTVEDDDVMDDQEVMEQDTTHPVEGEEKLERYTIHGLGATENVDDAVEDQEVAGQCVIDRTVENDDVMDSQEVVEQDTIHPMDGIAVEEEDKLEQHATHLLVSTKNVDDAVEEKEVVEQCVIDRTVENNDVMDDQELVEQDSAHLMDGIPVEEEEKLERHATHGPGSTESVDNVVKDQEAVEQCVIDRKDESTDGIAVNDQEKAVEQCAAYGMGTAENDDAKDDQEAVEVVSATANGRDGGIWKKDKVKMPYPLRPGKLKCPFYMSTGSCSYGFSCNFHHPPLKAKSDGSWRSSEQGNQVVAEILELNRIGLPIREGARNCTYYMRNGACRYGKHCHFNHPEHVIDAQFYAPTGWEDSALQLEKSPDHHTTVDDTSQLKKSSDDATLDDTSYSKKSSDHATLDDTSSSTGVLPPNILRMLLPPQKVPTTTEAKVIPVKKDSNWSSTSDDSDGCCSADSSDGPLCKQEHVDSLDGSLCKQEYVDYPERPGRPECPFYLRFGDCKFASRCKYHHSIEKYPTRYHPEVPSLGGKKKEYPERPGEPECPFYMKSQFCKFGAQCRFDHPKDSNPTLQIPVNAKQSVAANEDHQPTRITLGDHMPQQKQYPERPGQPDCRYYLQFGECKFMSACMFHHPRDVLPSGPAHSDQTEAEIHGMPECPFYLKSGKCKFGSACEFRHPKDICSTTEGAFGHRTGSAYNNFTRPENVVQQREQTKYPERPGEPECFQYMRHGFCRLQMNCRYHHPADQLYRKQ